MLVETDFLVNENHFVQYLKYSFDLQQFFYVKYISNESFIKACVAMDFLLSGNDILSFTFFWKLFLQLEGGQSLQKILFLLEETVFFSFF